MEKREIRLLLCIVYGLISILGCRQITDTLFLAEEDPQEDTTQTIQIEGADRVREGRSISLRAVISPSPAKQSVQWRSANPEIATVDSDSGLVMGISIGEVDIIVQAADNPKLMATQSISVEEATFVLLYTIPPGGVEDFALPLRTPGDVYNLTVDWGDGSEITTVTKEIDAVHTYTNEEETTYRVVIGGDLQFGDIDGDGVDDGSFGDDSYVGYGPVTEYNSSSYLSGVESFGKVRFINNTSTFERAILDFTLPLDKTDTPYLEGDISHMFSGAKQFNQDLNSWNLSRVTNMDQMFRDAFKFNNGEPPGESTNPFSWGDQLGQVTNMFRLFSFCSSFNQDIGDWDVSKVENMHRVLVSAILFNQDISGWDLSSVTDMGNVLWYADSFNQDMSGWSNWTKKDGVDYTLWLAETKIQKDNRLDYLPPGFTDFEGN